MHSWAATVAYAGTGRAPFGRGPSMAIMDRVRRGEHRLDGLPEPLRGIVEAALDPDPGAGPACRTCATGCAPTTAPRGRHPGLRGGATDPLTVPLAVVSQQAADEVTDRMPGEAPTGPVLEPDGHEPTRALPGEWRDDLQRGRADAWPQDDARPEQAAWPQEAWPQEDAWPPVPRRAPWPERLRRGLLLATGAVTAGAAVAAYPWPAAALLLAGTWLLRSGSLAASAAGDRRRLRGRRWYDGVQFLLAAPWHLTRSIAGTVLLALWSVGLALAAVLVCYAVAAGPTTTLFAGGAVFAGSLWLGPGASRVRSPLARVVAPALGGAAALAGRAGGRRRGRARAGAAGRHRRHVVVPGHRPAVRRRLAARRPAVPAAGRSTDRDARPASRDRRPRRGRPWQHGPHAAAGHHSLARRRPAPGPPTRRPLVLREVFLLPDQHR